MKFLTKFHEQERHASEEQISAVKKAWFEQFGMEMDILPQYPRKGDITYYFELIERGKTDQNLLKKLDIKKRDE